MKNGLYIDKAGTKRWYKDDLFHREDGPASEYPNGTKEWWLNDQLHRLDGPAIEWYDGTKFWYIDGKSIHCNSNEEFLRLVKLKEFW